MLIAFADGTSLRSSPPLTGLKLWLKGGFGITLATSKVSAWADQSGNGNDCSQGTDANRPTFTASAINGYPGVTFSAASQILSGATDPVSAGSDRYFIAVAKPVAGAGTFSPGGCLFTFRTAGTGNWYGYLGTVAGNTYGYGDGGGSLAITGPPTILNTNIAYEMGTTVGVRPTIAINGTAYLTPNSPVTNDNGTGHFAVGNVPSAPTQFFTGSICEILVYDHILSAPDLAQARLYIQTKYAIALGA